MGFDIWQEFEYPPQAANSHHTYCGELPSLELKTCWTRIFNLSLLFCLTEKHCLKFIANSVTLNTIMKLPPNVIDTILFINEIQVPCILGVNLSDLDLMEFLQQVIHIYNTASFSTSFSLLLSWRISPLMTQISAQSAFWYRWIINNTTICSSNPKF